MSNTRRAKNGGPFRQERFASSFNWGLMANLVAMRASVAPAEERAIIWFLQSLSWAEGGLTQIPVKDLERYCLDPKATLTVEAANAVRMFRAHWIAERSRGCVQTAIGKRIAEALDYTRSARTISIIDGPSRTGKSFEARAWCEQSAGMARYIEVPCSSDDMTFLRRVAEALGVNTHLKAKAWELRARIEYVLQGGDLMLVLDEAHYVWPQGRLRNAVPSRVNFINTALANYGVSVALVTTPQFYIAQRHVEKQTGWNSDQFIGRIGHVERLPERLSKADLMAVAAALLPEGNTTIYAKLAIYAAMSQKHLASIEATVKRARWLAGKDGRSKATAQDVDTAINESVIPSDSALAVSLRSRSPGRGPLRGAPAEFAPAGRESSAEGFNQFVSGETELRQNGRRGMDLLRRGFSSKASLQALLPSSPA